MVFAICLGLCALQTWAQNNLEDVVQQLTADGEGVDASYWNDKLEELSYLQEHPLNLNAATKEQLEQFPFLSPNLIENLLLYVYRHGGMKSYQEVMMVNDMDLATAQLLQPYVCVQPVEKEKERMSWRDMMRRGHHEMMTRLDVPFYTRAGYNTAYQGYPFYHNVRWQFRYADRLSVGLTAEKDAGEPFFEGRNKKGYDSYHPYLYMHGDGLLRTLALGDFKASYGMGLVLNMGMTLGKSASLNTLEGRPDGIKKHSSTDEYHFFRGAAVGLNLNRHLTADVLLSYRKMDGTLTADQEIGSIKTDGLHRRDLEWEKARTFTSVVAGTHVGYRGTAVGVGATVLYQQLDKAYNPTYREYNKFYPRGKDFLNTGLDYRLRWKKLSLQGETAVDKQGKVATTNVLRYALPSGHNVLLLHRFYDASYASLLARGVGEGNNTQNESGLYVGVEGKLCKYVRCNLYGDYFYFPWKRYLVSKTGTSGFDGVGQLTYAPREKLTLLLRYRFKEKYHDYTYPDGDKATIPYIQHRLRVQADFRPAQGLTWRATAECNHSHYSGQQASKGFVLNGGMDYVFRNMPLQVNLSMAWFDTDDYASRISLYEKGILYAFSIPSYYYQGIRLAAICQYKFTPRIVLQAKYAATHYTDRDVIGTGLDQIDGSTKSDLYLQLRVKI